jgi:3-hydroxyisobutyrate dehydrogenase-like beta-hydroxyacid dehydrogenase
LGIMGTAMCRNLLKCGAFSKVVVWNRTASKVGSATTPLPRYNTYTARERGAAYFMFISRVVSQASSVLRCSLQLRAHWVDMLQLVNGYWCGAAAAWGFF